MYQLLDYHPNNHISDIQIESENESKWILLEDIILTKYYAPDDSWSNELKESDDETIYWYFTITLLACTILLCSLSLLFLLRNIKTTNDVLMLAFYITSLALQVSELLLKLNQPHSVEPDMQSINIILTVISKWLSLNVTWILVQILLERLASSAQRPPFWDTVLTRLEAVAAVLTVYLFSLLYNIHVTDTVMFHANVTNTTNSNSHGYPQSENDVHSYMFVLYQLAITTMLPASIVLIASAILCKTIRKILKGQKVFLDRIGKSCKSKSTFLVHEVTTAVSSIVFVNIHVILTSPKSVYDCIQHASGMANETQPYGAKLHNFEPMFASVGQIIELMYYSYFVLMTPILFASNANIRSKFRCLIKFSQENTLKDAGRKDYV